MAAAHSGVHREQRPAISPEGLANGKLVLFNIDVGREFIS